MKLSLTVEYQNRYNKHVDGSFNLHIGCLWLAGCTDTMSGSNFTRFGRVVDIHVACKE